MASYSVFVVEPGEDIGNVLRHRGIHTHTNKKIHTRELSIQNSLMKSLTFSDALALCSECSDPTHSLVFYLSIAFGILFLVMLIVNLYLCCAMSRYGGITYRRKTSTTSNSSSDSNSDDVSKNSTVPRSEKTTSPGKSFSSGSIDT